MGLYLRKKPKFKLDAQDKMILKLFKELAKGKRNTTYTLYLGKNLYEEACKLVHHEEEVCEEDRQKEAA
jgi:hypothetical protein